MTLDLRSIPAAIVNLPTDKHRRAFMEEQFGSLGIQTKFVPGVTKFGKKKSVAAAYINAFEAMDQAPFVVFDDDQELLWDDCILPDIPADADIIYLATRNSGCLPDRPENKKKFGFHAYDGLALAEAFDETYLRLYSMISSMAVFVVSERGRERYRLELKKAYNRSTAADIRYAFAMPSLNVYALRQPMFAEKQSLQVPSKSGDLRVAATHTPLIVTTEGEVREASHRLRNLKVEAKRDVATQALNWEVLEVKPTTIVTPPATPALRLPGYNQDILKDRIEVIENAKVFPPDPTTNSCGVTDANGAFSRFSQEFKTPRRPSPPPEERRTNLDLPRLEGTYLYGGWLHPHFGHFLAESTARLWALEEYKEQIDGILYIPIGPKSIWRARKAYAPIIDIFSGGIPIIPETHPKTVERLILPEPGFGHQGRMRGTERYKNFMRKSVAETINPKGSERLYVSRSELNDTRGGVFGEKLIEAFMVANGYEIFHPQQHSAAEQLARYRAARYLVSLDGSALHFAAYALQPGAKVAIIKRRKSDIPDNISLQLGRFADAEVDLIEVIKRMWVKAGTRHIDHRSFGELDLAQLSGMLFDRGFLDKPDQLRNMRQEEIHAYLDSRHAGANKLAPIDAP